MAGAGVLDAGSQTYRTKVRYTAVGSAGIFLQTKTVDRFELTMRSALSIYVFRQCLESVFVAGTNPLGD